MPKVSELVSSSIGSALNNIQTWGVILTNAKSYGAVSDGITDDTAHVQLALNAASGTTNLVFIPFNTIYTLGSLTIPSGVIMWDMSQGFPIYWDWNANSLENSYMIRRHANFTGGTPGYVNGALRVTSKVEANVTSFEWGITSVMDDYASAGENVAIYGQSNKYGAGEAWAGVLEARDKTNTANPTTGLIGLEIDIFANGTDSNGQRVGLDIVIGKDGQSGSACGALAGIRIGPVNGDTTQGNFTSGLLVDAGTVTAAVNIRSSGTWAMKDSGTYTVGIDLSGGTHSSSAIRIKADEYIAFDATGTIKMKYNSTSQNIEFYTGATLVGHIVVNGGSDHAL